MSRQVICGNDNNVRTFFAGTRSTEQTNGAELLLMKPQYAKR